MPVAAARGLQMRFAGGMLAIMSEVTSILSAIEAGDPHAAEQLLPLVYDELGEGTVKCQAGAWRVIPGTRSKSASWLAR
jgi:hypothetical protein